ncbi:hypothetical protein AJ90_01740 [Vibrio parahaemolyticus M0605]|nr:hypothetical protein AJ90_01740 [Vibrio parahaemolyticus M0605]
MPIDLAYFVNSALHIVIVNVVEVIVKYAILSPWYHACQCRVSFKNKKFEMEMSI